MCFVIVPKLYAVWLTSQFSSSLFWCTFRLIVVYNSSFCCCFKDSIHKVAYMLWWHHNYIICHYYLCIYTYIYIYIIIEMFRYTILTKSCSDFLISITVLLMCGFSSPFVPVIALLRMTQFRLTVIAFLIHRRRYSHFIFGLASKDRARFTHNYTCYVYKNNSKIEPTICN